MSTRTWSLLTSAALLLGSAGCGDDDDGSASATTTSAAPATDDYCDLARELDGQQALPTAEQLEAILAVAPAEIHDDAQIVVDTLLAGIEDGDIEAAFGDPDLDEPFARINAFDQAECGLAAPSDEPAEPVEVVATDYAFAGLPERVAPGTELTLRNDSAAEAHELVAFDLRPDETRSAAEIFDLPADELEGFFQGDPNLVLLAPPGEDAIVVLGDGTLEREARYIVLCFIPTGADPQAYLEAAAASEGGPPEVPGGPPHFVQGMFGELTVG